MSVVSVADLTGIQRFVFGSARLRDNVVASCRLRWVLDDDQRDSPLCVAMRASGGEVIGSGGGNAVVRHPDRTAAGTWAAHLTRKITDQVPGLGLVVGHAEDGDGLAAAMLGALADADRRKRLGVSHAPLPLLPGVATCELTGQAAVTVRDGSPMGATVAALRRTIPGAPDAGTGDCELKTQYGATAREPLELDHLGRTHGEQSDIAVVHLDGNGFGARIQRWLRHHARVATPDDELGEEYAFDGLRLDDIMERVEQAVLKAATDAVGLDDDGEPVLRGHGDGTGFRLHTAEDGRSVHLPVRIVLRAGDDLTFVCDARVAHALARVALRALHDAVERPDDRPFGTEPISAAAGLAVHRAHHPIRLLAEEAERRTTAAKARQAALDWSLWDRTSEDLTSLQDGKSISARPLDLDGVDRLLSAVAELQRPPWSHRRGRRRAVLDAVRAGQDEEAAFLAAAARHGELRLPDRDIPPSRSVTADALQLQELVVLPVGLDPAEVRS